MAVIEARAVLRCEGLSAGYSGHPAINDLTLEINPGEILAMLGPNGAGKTTAVLALAGVLLPLSGQVHLNGTVANGPLHRRAGRGLALITDDRAIFPGLTVAENLKVGRCDATRAVALFPELSPLMSRPAGLLSGGEQSILTLARALARRPAILLADELSLGLAPIIVQRLHAALRTAADEDGIAVLMVEQHVNLALAIADRACVLRSGRVVITGPTSEIVGRLSDVEQSYLSADEAF